MALAITRQLIVFDAADLDTESAFWAGILGGVVDQDDGWHTILVDGAPHVAVQLAPEHHAPGWPDGDPQQIHLDLWVEDIEAAHAEVLALGADYLQAEKPSEEPDAFRVYADPAGHPFCLCWTK